jgi:hypothetical protein
MLAALVARVRRGVRDAIEEFSRAVEP